MTTKYFDLSEFIKHRVHKLSLVHLMSSNLNCPPGFLKDHGFE